MDGLDACKRQNRTTGAGAMIAQSVADILSHHVKLSVEGIDRMYLNVFVPRLQHEMGIVGFFREHRGQPLPSAALMQPMSRGFVAKLESFAAQREIPLVQFRKGQRKDDVMKEHLRKFGKDEGVVFIGKAQEKTPVFRTEKRRNPKTGQPYPWIVRSTAMVNHYYIYALDRDFGRPEQVQLIFNRKINRQTPGLFRTRVLTQDVTPSLNVYYKNAHIKQYHKENRALRTETTINNTYDFAIGKRLHNLPKLREVGFAANRRLLDVERLSHDCMLTEDTFQTINGPVAAGRQRASGLRFADARTQSLLHGLIPFRLLPNGFRCADLRRHLAILLGRDLESISQGAITYQLRRLRLHGLIERVPNSFRYRVTKFGLRVALFFTRTYNRILRPGLALALPGLSAIDAPLKHAFDKLDTQVNAWIEQAQLAPKT